MTITLDSLGARAIDRARDAAVDEAGADRVGEHLAAVAEDDRVVTHLFECTDRAYRGWRWSVTLARPPRSRSVTVDEVSLVVGPDSVVAPVWLPFGDRLRPEDLGVGDVIPSDPDDPRLVPGYTGADAEGDVSVLEPPLWEPGLGRPRVLSHLGRDEAAARWHTGDHGPTSPMAKFASLTCSSCGFLVLLRGPLGTAFGVCANDLAPSDGHVVALDYGCGAHSENVVVAAVAPADAVLDEFGYVEVGLPPEGEAVEEAAAADAPIASATAEEDTE